MTKWLLAKLIRFYQLTLSPWLGPRCRFTPSCSEYALSAIEHLPLYKALPKILIRLSKCHPFHPGGHDPVIKCEQGQHRSCK